MTERNLLPTEQQTFSDRQQMERKEEVKLGGAAMSLPADLSCLQGGGGAEGEAALATLEKQLICPICLELFNKPVVILPCQHNLCRKCANELYQPSLFQARTTMQVNSGRFRCPSCRHEVVLDRHGVYGLQRNLLVENIIDVYKQEVSNNSNATSALPPPPAAQVTCPDHEGEKVNIYCLTCQLPTCSLCKVFGAHRSCQVAPLTDVYQQQKDELREGVTSMVEVNNKVQTLIDELEETCRNIEENCKTQKQSVCEKFNRVFSILEERRKVMTQRISFEEEEKTGHTQALVRCYGDRVAANSKLVERATSSMEEPDMAAFVQNSRELITKVITAAGSGPAETLKPGYESLSHYRFNFSRQERALRSIDFLRVVEDVPEEPEVEPEPEDEPKEPSVPNVEPKHHQETSAQNLEPVSEPVKELISPPVEPAAPTAAAAAAAAAAPVPPAPGLLRDSVEPAGAVLQTETDDPELTDGGSDLMKNKNEEEDEEEEEEEETEGCAAPDAVKEGNVCEEEGMSTQQCEAVSDAGDWTAQSETEDKRDTHDEEEEEEDMMEEGMEATFYPGWYKGNSWRRVNHDPADVPPEVCDAEQTTGETWEQSTSFPDQPPPGPQPLSAELQLIMQAAGEGGVKEEEEEEDMQGWVCLPGAVDKSFSQVDGCLVSDNIDRASSSVPPEETRSGVERGRVELSDGRTEEDAEEKHDDLKCASEPKEGEAETDEGKSDQRKEKLHAVFGPESKNDRLDAGNCGVESKKSVTEGDGGDTELKAGSSEFSGKKDGEKSEQPDEKITSSVSLQAVTLLFYLLAFLLILQRVWAYIGCFICT